MDSVPPVDRDALTHHLFIPKMWLKHGGIHEIPENIFSYYPMNLDLLYTIPLYFNNDIVPKYIHYIFALLTGWIIFFHLKMRLGTNYGLLGALFFLSVPIIIKLSITVYVDLGLVFFSTSALIILLHWVESNFQWRFLLLAGFCCGMASGTKYNGILSTIILSLFVPILHEQNKKKEKSNSRAFLYVFVFIVITIATFSPWLIKNYIWTGNPIYPLHNSLFQKIRIPNVSQQILPTAEIRSTSQKVSSQGGNAFLERKILYNEPWWQTIFLPFRFFYEGQDDNPQYFDGKLTPFLLILPFLALIAKPLDSRQCREQKYLFLFALLYLLLTIFQYAIRIRYITPIIPSLVILSMYGLKGLFDKVLSWKKCTGRNKIIIFLLVASLPILMLSYNGIYIVDLFKTTNPLPYLRGEVSRDDYIANFRPEYPAIQYANSILLPEAKVMCLFLGNRGYYMNFEPVFEQPFGSGVFSNFFKTGMQNKNILDTINKKNISYVLMRDDLTMSWFQQLHNEDKLLVAPFLAKAEKPLFTRNGYTFFQMK